MALTLQRKRQIDILLPTLLATVAGVLVFRKKAGDYRLLIAAVIGAFILGYIITSQITKIIYTKGPDAAPVPAGAENYNPSSLAQRLYNDISCWVCLHDFDVYRELAGLSDAQFIKVYNEYNKNFYSKYNETLAVSIAEEGFGIANESLKQSLMQRFKSLRLN